jgi:5-methylcytosine-specific restriction endonuclease McrA
LPRPGDAPGSEARSYEVLIDTLLCCLGISRASFEEAIAWSLCEHMVTLLAEDRDRLLAMRNDPDFLAKFAEYLKQKTGRKWSLEDAQSMKARLLTRFDGSRNRQAIRYEDWLRLLFTTPLRCAICGKAPPDVKLEIDHIFPASKGGTSAAPNLRFLCVQHNRKKSAKLEVAKPWLKLR